MFKDEAERESEQFKLEFRKDLYNEFDPYVKKILSVLKKVFFNEDIRKYIITSEFLYPDEEYFIAQWQIRRKSQKFYTKKERIIITLGYNSFSGQTYFMSEIVKERPILRGYEHYTNEVVSKDDSFCIISRMLFKLVFDAYIENDLFFL